MFGGEDIWGEVAGDILKALAANAEAGTDSSPLIPEDLETASLVGVFVVLALTSWVTHRMFESTDARARDLSLVASHIHNGVLLCDSGGRIRWANASFESLSAARARTWPFGAPPASHVTRSTSTRSVARRTSCS